jgi:2-dehydro-3-deoxygluconokinase
MCTIRLRMDLVTFGEALIRLSPTHDRAQAAPGIVGHVGGAELNVAIGAARLGATARWVSRLPDNALGRYVDGVARTHGVETSVQWVSDAGARVGTYFLDEGTAPRQASVVYDRAGSAFSRIAPGSVNWESVLKDARWFHVTGISPALSDSAATATREALAAARSLGITISYDVNYRVKLWDAPRAREVQEPLLEYVDVLVVSRDDARTVFGVDGATAAESAKSLARRFRLRTVVVTTRDEADGTGAVVYGDDGIHVAPQFVAIIVERVGTGDAFTAALIASRLADRGWDEAVRRASAAAALKLSMRGDFFVGQPADIDRLMERAHAKAVS